MTAACLHVKIKAGTTELLEMGIEPADVKSILSGWAFPVERRRPSTGGRVALLLSHPETHKEFWVYEEHTEPIT